MTDAVRGALARLERSGRVLAAVKLANVGLAMLWGFAVTFVFVRILPLAEFRSFLVLVAFANFTVSADFGFSGIIYARLRRARIGEADPAEGFRPGEIALLFAFMTGIVLAGAAIIALCLAGGQFPTRHPALFLSFYILSATNIFALLVRRALAALDRNLLWDLMEAARRGLSILLLLAALIGLPILLSVAFQIALAAVAIVVGLIVVHRGTGMRGADWFALWRGRPGATRPYRADMGRTMLLTLSDVGAYNAPYFGIALATQDPRPMLVFDFLFKMSRALTAIIRALVEAMLPRLTEAFHQGRLTELSARIDRLRWIALGCAALLALLLVAVGPALSDILFDGKAVLSRGELLLIAPLLGGLAVICVSTYVHNGVGRFAALLPPSFAFLAGSVLSVVAGAATGRVMDFASAFLAAYALVHVATGLRHARMLKRLAHP